MLKNKAYKFTGFITIKTYSGTKNIYPYYSQKRLYALYEWESIEEPGELDRAEAELSTMKNITRNGSFFSLAELKRWSL